MFEKHGICVSLLLLSLSGWSGGTSRLRVCSSSGGDSFEVCEQQCSRGAWLPDSIQPDCVCASGLWLISEQYCDDKFLLIAGPPGESSEMTCFSVTKPLRRLVSLSATTRSYKHFLVQSNGEQITELPSAEHRPSPSTPVVIVRLNPTTDLFLAHKDGSHSSVWQKCVPRPPVHGDSSTKNDPSYIQIVKVDDSVSYFKSVGGHAPGVLSESCDDVRDGDFPYTVTNNTFWNVEYSDGVLWGVQEGLSKSKCNCEPPPPRQHHRSQVKQKLPYQNNKPEELEPPTGLVHNTDHDYDSSPSDISDLFSYRTDPLLMEERLRDNSVTTASILSHLKNYLLHGTQPPSLSAPTFAYIRFGRKVLERMCPEINVQVLTNLVGLFRILLSQVVSTYPDAYSNNLDVDTHQRVVERMGECVQGLKPVKFFWGRRGDGNRCERRIVSVEVNGSSVPLTDLPGGVSFKMGGARADIVLEVAWKTMLAAHYACTEYFEQHPDDLSFMYVKSQEFLTIPYVLFRWENPSHTLTESYRILNPGLNVQELGEQVDACVFAAFSKSPYTTWLSRPQSDSEFLRETIIRRSMGKLTNQGNGTSDKSVFGNQGYCVQRFNDPVRWTLIDQHVAAAC